MIIITVAFIFQFLLSGWPKVDIISRLCLISKSVNILNVLSLLCYLYHLVHLSYIIGTWNLIHLMNVTPLMFNQSL